MDRKRNKQSMRELIHKARRVHNELISHYVVGHGEGVLKHFHVLMNIQNKLAKNS